MSEAVSSRPTGINTLVYRGLNDDGWPQAPETGKLPGRNAEPRSALPVASENNAATLISLSAANWDELNTALKSTTDGTSISLPAFQSASSGVAHLSDQA